MPELHLTPFLVPDMQRSAHVPSSAIRCLPCVIGRAAVCDYRIDDPMISRRHCVFSFHDGQVWIEDLASCNGTRLDGEPVQGPRPVVDGALLQLARWTFTVELESSPVERHTQPSGLRDRQHGR
jgi:pSer/pThr/pTyr-binding forkhead associated (FHA) protein